MWLYKKRKIKGYTQSQVANLAKISLSYYNLIENGIRSPSVVTAKKISKVLDFEWISFFDFPIKKEDNTTLAGPLSSQDAIRKTS